MATSAPIVLRITRGDTTRVFSDDYLAGIFDGEGCLTAYLTPALSFQIVASVYMGGAEEICRAFQARFGGSSRQRPKYRKNGLPMWQWHMTIGSKRTEFLRWVIERCYQKNRIAEVLLPVALTTSSQYCGGSAKERLPRDIVEQRIEALVKTRLMTSGKADNIPRLDQLRARLH